MNTRIALLGQPNSGKSTVYNALTTTYRESHSLKWTAKVALFYIGSALLLSCIVYHIASIFM